MQISRDKCMLCECCIAITYVGMCIWQSLKQLKAGCLIPAWEKKKKGGEERKKRREKGERGEASSGDCWVLCPTGLSVRKLSGLVQLILIWSEMFSTSRHVYFPPSQNINFKTHVSPISIIGFIDCAKESWLRRIKLTYDLVKYCTNSEGDTVVCR